MTFSAWRPLIPAETEQAPDCSGVFELATLVRTVVFIGAAPESLGATLAQHLVLPGTLHLQMGRLYFRYQTAEEPEQTQLDLLEEYRRTHGSLPPAQSMSPPPPRPRRHLKAV